MEAIIERCSGLDVHESTVVACVLSGSLNDKPNKEIVTFNTTTKDLLRLSDWLEEKKCTHVAMESTGVYWKPVWNILDDGQFELVLANAKHIKNLPGRKTDIMDSEWIAQLLRSGLIRKSFVPEEQIRDLRDITRYRKKIVYDINREKNRVYKILEDCNIKLACFMSDLFGDTGTKIIEKIMNTEKIRMEDLIEFTKGRGKSPLRKKINELYEALNGNIKEHHIRMIKYSYNHLKFLKVQLESIEDQIEVYTKPYADEIEIIDSIPGISKKSAAIIIAEIGADMSFFPSDNHLTSWAGLSPGNNESAGKKKERELGMVIKT
jgi:transposase